MPLAAGIRLGPYEIVEPIGKGGMGEVYRARDTKLERDVAIKVLPEEFAKDKERLARFEREAKLLASLNHRNIASIHGFEDSDGVNAIVLELIEGPTLAERIAEGPIPVADAIAIAKQMTKALEAGHEAGVIHRDLKPANVKLKEDGTVKVLDYGLAKALEGGPPIGTASELSHSPTLTRQGTQIGVVLGTAAYMSPEQAQGKRVDKRTDIWAFGVVLFEMLAGRPPFPGDSVTQILVAVLEREPDWTALPRATPPAIRSLAERCLQKSRTERLRDIGDAFYLANEGEASPTRRSGARWLPWAIAVVAGLYALRPVGSERPEVSPPLPTHFVVDNVDARSQVALSPDGRSLAYQSTSNGVVSLFLRSMDSATSVPLPDTVGASSPFFSPDGEWLGFHSGGEWKKMPVRGGPAVVLVEGGNRGASWGADGFIYFADQSTIYRVSENGGEPRIVARPDFSEGVRTYRLPLALPESRGLVFVIGSSTTDSFDEGRIAVLPDPESEPRILIEGGSYPRYAESGHLLYVKGSALFAAPFDVEKLELTGTAISVWDGIWVHSTTGGAGFDVSLNGNLAFVPGENDGFRTRPVWVGRSGGVEHLDVASGVERLALSPDGRFAAFDIDNSRADIWVYDLQRGTLSRLTHEWANTRPLWTRDSRRLAYQARVAGGRGIVLQAADGSSPAHLVSAGSALHPSSWTLDGGGLLFTKMAPGGHSDIWTLSIQEGTERRVFSAPFDQAMPALSPDGRWLAYASNETGRFEVYVQPYPHLDRKWLISTAGGFDPKWNPNGFELFFRDPLSSGVMTVDVSHSPEFRASKPRLLSGGNFYHGFPSDPGTYDITPDGERFMMIEWDEPLPRTTVEVVVHFSEELKQYVLTNH